MLWTTLRVKPAYLPVDQDRSWQKPAGWHADENVRSLPVDGGNEEMTLALDELAREGARPMIAAALRTEPDEYVERFSGEVDEDGHRNPVPLT